MHWRACSACGVPARFIVSCLGGATGRAVSVGSGVVLAMFIEKSTDLNLGPERIQVSSDGSKVINCGEMRGFFWNDLLE
jgi:hypothetical protein